MRCGKPSISFPLSSSTTHSNALTMYGFSSSGTSCSVFNASMHGSMLPVSMPLLIAAVCSGDHIFFTIGTMPFHKRGSRYGPLTEGHGVGGAVIGPNHDESSSRRTFVLRISSTAKAVNCRCWTPSGAPFCGTGDFSIRFEPTWTMSIMKLPQYR